MKIIPLTKGKFAIVDDEDFARLNKHRWCAGKGNNKSAKYYAMCGQKKTTIRMHREVLMCPKGLCIDHRNGNTLDNRKENLRICTHTENMRNLKARGGTSRFKGVAFHMGTKKWRAKIVVEGRQRHLGLFVNELDAARAYNDAAMKVFGEFAWLNAI